MGESVVVENWLGRMLRADDLEVIWGGGCAADPLLRVEIACRLCTVPAPRNGNGNGRALVRQPPAWPQPQPVMCALGELVGPHSEAVCGKSASRLHNGLIDRWH